ncbi:MAG: type II secretion system F family protein, partial [Planctomycetota bacterium]
MNDPLILQILIGSAVVLVGGGVFVWSLQAISRRGSAYGQALMWVLGLLGWSVIGVFVFVPATVVIGFFMPLLAAFSPLLALMAVVLLGHAAWLRRRQRGLTVLSALEQATRQHLPVPEVLRAAALGESRALRTKMNRLAGWIEDGNAIGEGLEQHVKELPATQRACVLSGERAGRLPETLRALRGEAIDAFRSDSGGTSAWIGLAYGISVSAATLTLISLMTLLIFPKFVEIFDDFGVQMPWVTIVTFELFGSSATNRTGSPGPLPGLLLIASVASFAFIIGGSLRMCGSSGAAMSRGAAAVLRGWAGTLPVLGAPLRRGAWARSYTALALAFRGGEGLPEAAAIASLAAADRHVERRWERFARFVEQGQPADVAARKARLPRVDRVAMSIQRPPTDLPSAARFLATRHDAARQRA